MDIPPLNLKSNNRKLVKITINTAWVTISENSMAMGLISNVNLNTILIDEIKLISQNGDYLECEVEFNYKDYKLTVLNIIENDDLVIKFQDGKYSYERIIPDGTIRKPLEELIQKNINKLFENLLQWF